MNLSLRNAEGHHALMKRGPGLIWIARKYATLISRLRKLTGKEMVNVNGRLMMEREPTLTWKNVFGGIRLLKRFDGKISTGEDNSAHLPTKV